MADHKSCDGHSAREILLVKVLRLLFLAGGGIWLVMSLLTKDAWGALFGSVCIVSGLVWK
jgi:hypothetical protein